MSDNVHSRSAEIESHNGETSSGALKLEATERILRLLRLLLANTCTRRDIFEHLAIHYKLDRDTLGQEIPKRVNKMLERDLQFLEEQGFEIHKMKKSAQPTLYHIVQGSGPETTFLFTSQEVDSLALLYSLFEDPTRYASNNPSQPLPQQPSRHPFAEDVLALFKKISSTLPDAQKKQFDRWVRKPYLYFNFSTVADYLPHRSTIDTIIQAISVHQQLQFEYLPSNRQQHVVFHEHIDPYYITYLEGHFYLIAYNHKMNEFLEYRIDRIRD